MERKTEIFEEMSQRHTHAHTLTSGVTGTRRRRLISCNYRICEKPLTNSLTPLSRYLTSIARGGLILTFQPSYSNISQIIAMLLCRVTASVSNDHLSYLLLMEDYLILKMFFFQILTLILRAT